MNKCKTYSAKDVADIIGVTVSMVYKMIRNNAIPYIQIGKRYVIPIDSFNIWFKDSIIGG